MSLENLSQFVPAQTLKINKLLARKGLFSRFTPFLSSWDAFRRSVWGKGLASFQREEPVQRSDDPVSEQAPTTCSVMRFPCDIPSHWSLGIKQILVRSEYEEAERAAVWSNAHAMDALLVTGQPGIGKSAFLAWLLVRRLALGLPTVLQVRKEYAVLFHACGTAQFKNLDDAFFYLGLKFPPCSLSRIWALVDSSSSLKNPAPLFTSSAPFFVVESVPSYQRRRMWAENVSSDWFYMKTWSFSEVIQARPFIGLLHEGPYEERELWHLYNTYGASPRALCIFSRDPDAYRNMVIKQARAIKLSTLEYALRSPFSDPSFDLIVVLDPSPENRLLHQNRIASLWILKFLSNLLSKNQPSEMRRFYNLFQRNRVAATTSGWAFELQAHQLLREVNRIQLFPVGCHITEGIFIYNDYTASRYGRNQRFLQLPGSKGHLLRGGVKLEVGHYYRRQATSDAVSSLFLVCPPDEPSPILLVFWITWNEARHEISEDDLRRIDELDLPPYTRRCYVVVTPSNVQPEIRVPEAYFMGRGKRGREAEDIFPVFHYPVRMDTLF